MRVSGISFTLSSSMSVITGIAKVIRSLKQEEAYANFIQDSKISILIEHCILLLLKRPLKVNGFK